MRAIKAAIAGAPVDPAQPARRGAFDRTGAVEVWGRGTNCVVEACRAHGIAPPEFADEAGVITVTFKVDVVRGAVQGPSRDQVGTKSGLREVQIHILEIAIVPNSIQELMAHAGRTNRTKFRDKSWHRSSMPASSR